ncbi:GntR family transcriptional regulator [Billgrantia aerodenitrificans]|uniref:GntR family transcriptional regulator n=1 Tax=Billgrantia aerodenitrificans TaxID=2733483 RepID=A0ABS9AN65_9GAMM|nr:GntR family transcriptional regulator [Halomonas aerodenitrificans]MCE8023174.1 GntR family transcriptional regulator [Halomonas aerodenitrificans]
MQTAQRKKTNPEVVAKRMLALVHEKNIPVGSHLPETFFADNLKVSRTPIRSALAFLESQGVVKKEPNRGYFLVTPKISESDEVEDLVVDSSSPISPLAFNIAVDYLKGKLGRTITETELANVYNTNRFSIQQALVSMETEGWVSKLMGYGWEFNEFLTSKETYDQCYRYRILIEPAALREPGYTVDRRLFRQLRRLQADTLNMDDRDITERHMFLVGTFFHESIVACAKNVFLLEGLQRANRLRKLMEYNVFMKRDSPKPESKEHLIILDLLEEGKNEEAAEFLGRHLERARREKMKIASHLFDG